MHLIEWLLIPVTSLLVFAPSMWRLWRCQRQRPEKSFSVPIHHAETLEAFR